MSEPQSALLLRKQLAGTQSEWLEKYSAVRCFCFSRISPRVATACARSLSLSVLAARARAKRFHLECDTPSQPDFWTSCGPARSFDFLSRPWKPPPGARSLGSAPSPIGPRDKSIRAASKAHLDPPCFNLQIPATSWESIGTHRASPGGLPFPSGTLSSSSRPLLSVSLSARALSLSLLALHGVWSRAFFFARAPRLDSRIRDPSCSQRPSNIRIPTSASSRRRFDRRPKIIAALSPSWSSARPAVYL